MRKIIILAGNRREFEDYLSKNGLTDSEAVYGFDERALAGVEATKIEIIGTFFDRKNAYDLERFARTRIR